MSFQRQQGNNNQQQPGNNNQRQQQQPGNNNQRQQQQQPGNYNQRQQQRQGGQRGKYNQKQQQQGGQSGNYNQQPQGQQGNFNNQKKQLFSFYHETLLHDLEIYMNKIYWDTFALMIFIVLTIIGIITGNKIVGNIGGFICVVIILYIFSHSSRWDFSSQSFYDSKEALTDKFDYRKTGEWIISDTWYI